MAAICHSLNCKSEGAERIASAFAPGTVFLLCRRCREEWPVVSDLPPAPGLLARVRRFLPWAA